METSTFFIYEVKVVVASNNKAFLTFVEATLQNYSQNNQEPKFEINVVIDVNGTSQIKKSKFRIGNGIFLDDIHKRIAFNHKLFLGAFTKNDANTLSVRGEVKKGFNESVKHQIKALLINGYSYQEMLFHQLYRELILMPVFWMLRHKFQKHLMHASAVKNGDKVYVFLGNDGVGKTTIALKLLKENKALFYGDNFLLYDSEKIYPFIDTLRVNKNDTRALKTYGDTSLFKKVAQGKSRTHFNFNKQRVAESHAPTHFFVLKQTGKNSKKEISSDTFVNYVTAINDYVKEFDKYSYTSNLMFLYNTQSNINKQETDFLSKLVYNKKCALLNLNKDEELFDLLN